MHWREWTMSKANSQEIVSLKINPWKGLFPVPPKIIKVRTSTNGRSTLFGEKEIWFTVDHAELELFWEECEFNYRDLVMSDLGRMFYAQPDLPDYREYNGACRGAIAATRFGV